MQYGKVEICGVNTSRLKLLSEDKKQELLKIIKNGSPAERKKARDEMINGNLRLVLSVIQRFVGRGENPDDLFQVGVIGLIKAIDNFDPGLDVRFSTYGVPTMYSSRNANDYPAGGTFMSILSTVQAIDLGIASIEARDDIPPKTKEQAIRLLKSLEQADWHKSWSKESVIDALNAYKERTGRAPTVTNLKELDTAALLGEVMDIMSNNYISIPGEYTMLVRSIATIEGVMEELCPELNLFEIITDKLLERAKQSFDLQQTLLSAGKDAVALGKKASRIPSLAADALTGVTKGRTKVKFELTGYEELLGHLTKTVKLVILALFSCVMFFGSCILCMTDMQPTTVDGVPLMAVIGFIFSIALGIYTVKKINRLLEKH